jgi:ferredoxin/nitrate reductase gamma subunit
MVNINPDLIKDVKKYGTFDISACFNCGNCTAICPLAKEDAPFPRHLIRRAHLGDKKALLTAKGTWLCYYCGECSKTCPRDAKPAAFMAAARRYVIAKSDITGVTSLLYKFPVLNFLVITALTIFFALFMYANRLQLRSMGTVIEVFSMPYDLIHTIGIVIMTIAGITLLTGMLVITLRGGDPGRLLRAVKESPAAKKGIWFIGRFIKTAFDSVLLEMVAFKRFRDCDAEKKEIRLWLKPWFLHGTVAWGFMGLFGATVMDFIFKDPEGLVSLWYPPRLLGTISGLFLIYGSTVIILNRLRQKEVNYSNGSFSDWWFILTLWFVGVTGFALEILVYLPQPDQVTADVLFLAHVAPSMVLVVMAAFTKLAHVFYRMQALFADRLFAQIKEDLLK